MYKFIEKTPYLVGSAQVVELRGVLGVERGQAPLQGARALPQRGALALVLRLQLRARAPRRRQRARLLRQRALAARALLVQPAACHVLG